MNQTQINAAISEALSMMNVHAQRNINLAVDLVTARTALAERDAELAALKESIAKTTGAPANK